MSVTPKDVAEPTALVRDLDHLLAVLGFCDIDFTRAQVERWMTVIERWQPARVLDSMGVACCAAARILDVPVIEVLQGDFHPDGPGFTWWLSPTQSPSPTEAFNEVLAGHGVGPIDRAARLLVGSRTVVVGSAATDPVPDPKLVHVGLLAWGDPSAELPEVVTALARRPLIFLYGGKPRYRPGNVTWGDSAVVWDASLEALAGMDVDVVLGAGNQPLPNSLPDNVIALEYAPGQALARRANAMIHHGGHGSTLTALAAGTPALVIPTYSERESNGRRVAAMGAGVCLVPDSVGGDRHLDPKVVSSTIQALLEDPRYTDAARTAANELAPLSGPVGVAEVVEADS